MQTWTTGRNDDLHQNVPRAAPLPLVPLMTDVEFDTALRTLATRAHSRYAGEGARIDRGLILALNGHVALLADGSAVVRSEKDQEVFYHVAQHQCDCPDSTRAPQGRCKHRYAACLMKKAHRAEETAAATMQWYARLLNDARGEVSGIATYTPTGWIFTPENGTSVCVDDLRDLCLLGHVATADTQQDTDAAARRTAWECGSGWLA